MIELQPTPILQADFLPEQYQKFQHAVQHDREDEAIIEALNDPDDVFEMSLDLRGTRKIIFGLMIDLGLIPTIYPADYKINGKRETVL